MKFSSVPRPGRRVHASQAFRGSISSCNRLRHGVTLFATADTRGLHGRRSIYKRVQIFVLAGHRHPSGPRDCRGTLLGLPGPASDAVRLMGCTNGVLQSLCSGNCNCGHTNIILSSVQSGRKMRVGVFSPVSQSGRAQVVTIVSTLGGACNQGGVDLTARNTAPPCHVGHRRLSRQCAAD